MNSPPTATVAREELAEVAEVLASALHHHNIGRDIRGWEEVSEAFAAVKDILDTTRGTDDEAGGM
jgi:hypothetical protein